MVIYLLRFIHEDLSEVGDAYVSESVAKAAAAKLNAANKQYPHWFVDEVQLITSM